MKKIIVIFMLFFFPIYINANECDNLLEEANKIEVSYSFHYDKENNPKYKITLKNMSKKLAVIAQDGSDCLDGVFDADATNTVTYLDIPVYDSSFECKTPIKIINVKLPMYNMYSAMQVCEGIEDYKYCSEFIDENIDSAEVEMKIEEFRENLIDEGKLADEDFDSLKTEKENNTLTYLLALIALILIISFGTSIVLYKRKKAKGAK